MIEEESNLSEKELFCDKCHGRFMKEDVKEFIKKIRKMLYPSQIEEIDKLAGEDLKC